MVKKMVSDLVDSGSKVPRWVLTNFKDSNVELVTSTDNVDDLRSSLNDFTYGGGGDLTEQVLQGNLILFLAALASLYLTLVTGSVTDRHFRILTQRVTFETSDPSDI